MPNELQTAIDRLTNEILHRLMVFGLAVLVTPLFLTPDWIVIAGGVAFGGAVSYSVLKRLGL